VPLLLELRWRLVVVVGFVLVVTRVVDVVGLVVVAAVEAFVLGPLDDEDDDAAVAVEFAAGRFCV